MKKWIKGMLVAMVAVSFIGFAPVKAVAQGIEDKPVSLDVQEADVRDVLRVLFLDVGGSYSIDPGITGSVTISVKQQPFRSVLESVVKQVNASIRVEGAVYHIVPRQEISITPQTQPDFIAPPARPRIQRIKIMHADPQFVFLMMRGNRTFNRAPEISALAIGAGGGGGGVGGVGGGGVGGGGVSGGGGGVGGGGVGGGGGGGGGGVGGGGGAL